MAVVLAGRSGITSALMSASGLNQLGGATRKVPTTYKRSADFASLQAEHGLNHCQMLCVCGVKLIFWHYGQVAFFMIASVASWPLMGTWQRIFAAGVVIKELWYFTITTMSVTLFKKRNFLLFAPMSDTHSKLWLMYFLDPDAFIALEIAASTFAVSDYIAYITVFISIAGGLSALLAMIIGFIGGTMYPALLLGYVLSATSLPLGIAFFMDEPGAYHDY